MLMRLEEQSRKGRFGRILCRSQLEHDGFSREHLNFLRRQLWQDGAEGQVGISFAGGVDISCPVNGGLSPMIKLLGRCNAWRGSVQYDGSAQR